MGKGAVCGEGSDHVRVSVTDTGPGISPDDQQLIFEKFRQLDGSVTRQHSGTRIGLAISRELADMLGARIEVASEVGKGSTFAVMPWRGEGPAGPLEFNDLFSCAMFCQAVGTPLPYCG